MARQDLVSIVVTTYNRAQYLGEALESALNQTYPNTEIIVIDDGSTDPTRELMTKYPSSIHYHYQDNAGMAAAKNQGLALARGEFITFLDSDDLMMSHKLALQYETLELNPDIKLVYCHSQNFVSPELSHEEVRGMLCPLEPMPAPVSAALLCRRETYLTVGELRTDLDLSVELDWQLRARSLNMRIEILPDVLYKRRIHAGNTSFSVRDHQRQQTDILKAHLDKMRNHKRSPI